MAVSGSAIVAAAKKLLGDPYVYGGTSPSGFDCSGLVQYVFNELGISLPRTSEEQYAAAAPISASPSSPPPIGSLVFAQFPGDNASPGHVGIYVGGGQVLSAEDPASGVGLSSLASWGSNIVGYGQAPGTSAGGTGGTGPSGTGNTGTDTQGNVVSTSIGGMWDELRKLVHAVAVAIDYAFAMFEPGQGFRALFLAGAVVAGFVSFKILGSSGAEAKAAL